jgi:hypothetical protein
VGDDAADNDVIVFLQSPRAAAAIRAKLRRQRAKGIPITFKRGTAIIKRYPDGREEKLGEVARPKYRLPPGVSIISRT